MRVAVLSGVVLLVAASCGNMMMMPDAGRRGGGSSGSGGGAAAGGIAGGGSASAGGEASGGGTAGGVATADGGNEMADGGADGGSTSTGAGESCVDAADLRAASMPLMPMGMGNFTHRLAGAMGKTDDYDPYSRSGKPPMCTVIESFAAPGLERVFKVQLMPGQRLDMELKLTPDTFPNTARPGLYVLNSCNPPAIADFDRSGGCGSNEYNAGFCGIGGCEPAKLRPAYTHPADAGVSDVFVVIDEATRSVPDGGMIATGFTLDWAIR